ncbi:hypothetical protein F0562_023191 [Nyssa sinensis]|uniref:Uncharacterized protein n=1 Tax=Nyssa sinensis TaxID=561372 RepID=A0A5J5BH43_9ASTE|nr:hypothetical protein F0562_023191 [Nyssa sinensis]
MAFRTATYWKLMLSRLRGSSTFSTSTSPKMKAYAPRTADFGHVQDTKPRRVKGDFVPVYVVAGMIMLSTTLGLYTATHELKHAPNVHLRKSRRETLPELEDPNHVLDEADKFIKKSFFRKVAHVRN